LKDIRQKLIGIFKAESGEHLASIRTILEREGAGIAGANLDEVFRRAHSLKGASRAMDLRNVESLAHPLETLFVRVREGALKLEPNVMKVVHLVLDAIEDGVASMLAGQPPKEPAQAISAITAVLGDAGGSTAGARRVSGAVEAQRLTPPGPPLLRGGNAGDGAKGEPAILAQAAPAASATAPSAPVIAANAAATAASTARAGATLESVRVNTSVIDRLHRSAGQLAIEGQRQDLVTQGIAQLNANMSAVMKECDSMRSYAGAALRRMEETPEFARVSRHMNFVEQQVRRVSKDVRALRLLQQRSAWALQNVGEQLRQDVLGARMISADNIFETFGKMMRDLARDEGKEIQFRSSGMQIEADRLVLQALKDPLMHVLRNTIAHGIETPAERKAAGKNSAGTVHFTLETSGNRLRAIVEDDGRGVNLTRVTEIAIQKRLITAAQAATLVPAETMRLIFHPGFSTARAVTSLSGRGMGLNVVTDAAARLQGSVDVENLPKCGTRFVISVPLAISTHRLLFVKCGAQTYAIACHAIAGLHRIRAREILTLEGRPAVSLNGKPVPLAGLAHLLRHGELPDFSAVKIIPIVVLTAGEKSIAVAVDELLDEKEGVVKDLHPIVMKAKKLSGGVLTGDGSVVLVLNAPDLIDAFQTLDTAPLLKSATTREKRTPTILVVDDSITTRSLEKSILETNGYHVLVAMDGMEALSRLRTEKIDLVVCDVEMPRLDGFGVLQEVKKDEQLAKIPFIMVTSLEKREDKERGLSLGADGYIVKRKFDQKDLLDTVRQML
jgi:two-component system chemotaxis sensor kinase CheA